MLKKWFHHIWSKFAASSRAAPDDGHTHPLRLEAYMDNALPAGERAALEAHLQECVACRQWLQREQEFGQLLRQAAPPPQTLTPAQVEDIRRGIYRRIRRSIAMNRISTTLQYAVWTGLFLFLAGLFIWWQVVGIPAAAPEATPTTAPVTPTPTPIVERPSPTATAAPLVAEIPEATPVPLSATYFVLPQHLRQANALAREFNQANPGLRIQVRDQMPAGDGWHDLLLAEQYDCFMSGSAAAVARLAPLVIPLDPFLEDEAAFMAGFHPDLLAVNRVDGALLGLPAAVMPQAIYYNATRLAQLGLDPPAPDWTVADFWALAAAAAGSDNDAAVYGYLAGRLEGADGLAFLLEEAGLRYYLPSPPQVAFDDPDLEQFLRHLAEMSQAGVLYPLDMGGTRSYSGNRSEANTQVRLGRVALWSNWAGQPYGMERPAGDPPVFEVGVAPLPAGIPVAPYYSLSHYISRQAEQPAVCWEWIKFLTTQPNELYPGLPAHQATLESDAWVESVGAAPAETYRAILERMVYDDPLPVPPPVPLTQWWEDLLAAVLLDAADPAEAARQAQQKGEALLACAATAGLDLTDFSWENSQAIAACAREADPDYQTREELGGFLLPDHPPIPPQPQEDDGERVVLEGLGFSLEAPAGWSVTEDDDFVYFMSDEQYGEGPEPLRYFVYAQEYPNPDQLPFADLVTADLGEAIQENFTYTTATIGPYTVHQTEWIPARSGALTVFFVLPDRYLALALTPYDSRQPWPHQDEYVALFGAMLQSFQAEGE